MKDDNRQINALFQEWRSNMEGYRLPEWKDFPGLELYMDQVTILVNQYLTMFEADKQADNVVTPAMINNYVKMKIVPAPVKKRYTRVHLAYLVMVCTLKQTMSMDMIRELLPVEMEEEQVRLTYQTFVENQKKTFGLLIELIDAKKIMPVEGDEGVRDMVIQTAVFSNLSRSLTRAFLTLMENEEQ